MSEPDLQAATPPTGAGQPEGRSWRRLVALLPLLLIAGLALHPGLERAGGAQLDAMTERALVSFAVARGLNAAVSVAQGTEVALQPAGVGLTLTVGEVLDPVNDLIERLSWVLLASATALGVQGVLLAVVVHPWMTGLLVVLTAFLVAASFVAPLGRFSPLLWRAWVLLLFVRLCVPVAALSAGLFASEFLEVQRLAAEGRLETTRESVAALQTEAAPPPPSEELSLLEGARRFIDQQAERLAVSERMARLEAQLEAAVEGAIDLIVVFALETILVPLAAIWLCWRLALWAIAAGPRGAGRE